MLVAVQEQLAAVGIDVDFKIFDDAAYREIIWSPEQGNEIRVADARYDPPNLLGHVRLDLQEKTQANPPTKRPEGFQSRFEQAMGEVDPNKQLQLLAEMEKIAYDNVMYVPLWDNTMFAIYIPKLHDPIWYPTGPFQKLQYAWLEEDVRH